MGSAAATHINSTLDMQDVSQLWMRVWGKRVGGWGWWSFNWVMCDQIKLTIALRTSARMWLKMSVLCWRGVWFKRVSCGSGLVHSQVIWRPWGSCVKFPTLFAGSPASPQKQLALARGNGSCWLLKASPSFAAPLKRTWHPQIYRPPHGRSALSWRLRSGSAGNRGTKGEGGESREKGIRRSVDREQRKRHTETNTHSENRY